MSIGNFPDILSRGILAGMASVGRSGVGGPAAAILQEVFIRDVFSSHTLNSQHFKLRVSNPGTVACVHFKLPFESSNLPGAGPISQIELLTTCQCTVYVNIELHIRYYVNMLNNNSNHTTTNNDNKAAILRAQKATQNSAGRERVTPYPDKVVSESRSEKNNKEQTIISRVGASLPTSDICICVVYIYIYIDNYTCVCYVMSCYVMLCCVIHIYIYI